MNACYKKTATTTFGNGVAGGDYLSTTLERRLSKDKSEVLGMYIRMYLETAIIT